MADQGEPSGERDEKQILHQRRTLLELVVNRVRFSLFSRDNGADVLNEIDATFFAIAAGALLVAAGRAFEAHRGVATLTEARHFAHGGPALGALHGGLRGWRI